MNFELQGMYSFEVYPVAQLGTAFKNVKVLSILDPETAEASGMDIRAMHAMVYPSLPPSTPNDPTKYNYVKIKTPSGQTQILGMAWIVANTVETVNLGKFTVELDNLASSEQQSIINALAANGKRVTKIVFQAADSA